MRCSADEAQADAHWLESVAKIWVRGAYLREVRLGQRNHFWAACQNCLYPQEYNIEPHPLRDDTPILKTPLRVVEGHLAVPQGPGLGVEVDEDVLAAHSDA